jgi:hypothetical protein
MEVGTKEVQAGLTRSAPRVHGMGQGAVGVVDRRAYRKTVEAEKSRTDGFDEVLNSE